MLTYFNATRIEDTSRSSGSTKSDPLSLVHNSHALNIGERKKNKNAVQ